MTKNKERKKPVRLLSEREKRLVQLLIDGKCFTEAMMMAGYASSTACTQQRRTRSKLLIQKALIEARIAKKLYVTPDERALVGRVVQVRNVEDVVIVGEQR
jgi:phage terminase small subunit